MGGLIDSQVKHHTFLPRLSLSIYVCLFVSFYLFYIAPSQSSCLLSAPSSQMCHINSTAAVPINVHCHSLHTLVFSFFSPLNTICVFEREVRQLLALHFLVKP